MLKILVVSHDAGGANILSSLIKKYQNRFNWVTCISGPAKKIFLYKNIKAKRAHLKNNNINGVLRSLRPDLLLAGTSWESDWELNFIKSSKANNIKTASFLDHWCHYRRRFGYPGNWKANLPDFIFTADKWAYKTALGDGFPKSMLLEVENPYFEEVAKMVKLIRKNKIREGKNNKIRILYVSQPIRGHSLKYNRDAESWGYTEYRVIKDLLNILLLEDIGSNPEFKIRLHPAEKINKYSSLTNNKKYVQIRKSISLSDPLKNSLIEDCAWADLVVGSESMALVIALTIGRRAISYTPDARQASTLPQEEIKKIDSFEELIKEIRAFKEGRYHKARKDNGNITNNLFVNAVKKIIYP